MTENRKIQLEGGMLLFEPRRLVARLKTVRDVFEYRHVLKQTAFSESLVEHVTRLVHEGLNTRARFRVFDSLRILRALILTGGERQLPSPTVERLVAIYEALIFDSCEEMQWCLSRLLKNQVLSDNTIGWLVDHWANSVHIVNRLLRYPKAHPRIVEWAAARRRCRDLEDRRSELISILLTTAPTEAFGNEDPELLGWAIMQSHLSRRAKIKRLSELVADLPAETLITFASRLGAPILLKRALKSPNRASRQRGKTSNQPEPAHAARSLRAAHSCRLG
jgi:hypothetical protein